MGESYSSLISGAAVGSASDS